MTSKEFLEKLINDIEEQNEIVSKEPHLIINIKVNAEAFIPLLHDIKQDLDRLKKLEKAIEILEDKMGLILFDYPPYEIWLEGKSEELTQEQYELLKEVLGNE